MKAETTSDAEHETGARVLFWRRYRWTLIASASIAAWEFLPIPRGVVETFYSRWLFAWISAIPIWIADQVTFSLGGLLLGGLALAVPLAIVVSFRRSRSRKVSVRSWLSTQFGRLVSTAVFGYLLFIFLWGANYSRLTVESHLALGHHEVSEEDVLELAQWLATLVKENASSDVADRDVGKSMAAIRQRMKRCLKNWQGGPIPRVPARVKRTPPGMFLTFGTAGMLLPIFIEPLVDGAITDVQVVSVGVHEWAHSVGFAGEADAELIGMIVGMTTPDRFAVYSCALRSLGQCLPDLKKKDRQAISDSLPPVAKADFDAGRRVVRAYESKVLSDAQTVVHDTFLKSQGVSEGVRDYSRAVRLLVRARQAGQFIK